MELPAPDSLRCFVAAARLLNFRAASRTVGLTPAALGQRIAGLEHQVGRALFLRNNRRVTLTEAGFAFLPEAERALEGLATALRAGRGETAPPPRDLVLGTRHELGMSWLAPMVPRLGRAHPHVTFNLYFGSGADLLLRLRNREIDCAVGSMRSFDPRIVWARLHREDYVFCGAPRLLDRTPLTRPADAAHHTLIDENAQMPLYAYWRDAPRAATLAFARIVHMGTIAAIRYAIAAGSGVGVLPRYLVEPDLRAGRLRVVLPRIAPLTDHFRLYFRADDPRRALYESLATAMLREPLR
jgi:LysR family transcriptional regulator, glycine cleavage system transcriptional activator